MKLTRLLSSGLAAEIITAGLVVIVAGGSTITTIGGLLLIGVAVLVALVRCSTDLAQAETPLPDPHLRDEFRRHGNWPPRHSVARSTRTRGSHLCR